MRKFTQLNGKIATIILDHCWFDKQVFIAEELNLICDDDRLGLILRGQDIFIPAKQLREVKLNDNVVMFADDKLKILIKL